MQLGGDHPGPLVQLRVGQMDLLVLAVDQVGEGAVLRLVQCAVLQQIDQIRRTKKRTGQMIKMHWDSHSFTAESVGQSERRTSRQLRLPTAVESCSVPATPASAAPVRIRADLSQQSRPAQAGVAIATVSSAATGGRQDI